MKTKTLSEDGPTPFARPWTEEVTFVECPLCYACNDLGTGLVWNDGAEIECCRCLMKFVLMRGGDDR